MLVSLLDAHDVHYEGHSRAVAALADMVARRLGLPEPERRTIHFAALLHDVGKLRLGPGILATEGPLTPEAKALVRQHPALGVEILRPIERWSELAPIIHTHHERWDGQGYPRGLAGTEIPLGGRIVAIAEAFEAMIRPTPFGSRRTIDEGLAEVARLRRHPVRPHARAPLRGGVRGEPGTAPRRRRLRRRRRPPVLHSPACPTRRARSARRRESDWSRPRGSRPSGASFPRWSTS